jgi:hypothetical protein
VLVGEGEQAASPLNDLTAVAASDPVDQLAVKVRGPIQRHRAGELGPPAMLAPKRPPPPGHHPDHRIGLTGHPKVAAGQVPGEIPRLLQGIQPASAVALRGGTAGCRARRPLRVHRVASQLASELPGPQT